MGDVNLVLLAMPALTCFYCNFNKHETNNMILY